MTSSLPPSVSYHLWQPCNMHCRGCFARFEDVCDGVLPRGHLPRESALALTRILAERFEKITFAGGEPTLAPWLQDLVRAAKAASATTMLVTNGTRLSPSYLESVAGALDWLTLSVDSANPATHVLLGRAARAGALSNEHYLSAGVRARALGMRLKINTVVSRVNVDENMSPFILAMQPARWKILQVLTVGGQNDQDTEVLRIAPPEFEAFVARHLSLKMSGIDVVPEDNAAMTGSYAMVDPAGRFFDNTQGRHTYSRAILEVGIDAAWRDIRFDHARFRERGGLYAW